MKTPVRALLIGLLAAVTLASACLPPPPWRVKERHDERGERHERREARSDRHERKEDRRDERKERRDDRKEHRRDHREKYH